MNSTGDSDLLVRARGALLDALEALKAHRSQIVVIGAQAVYLHTGGTRLAIAEATKDSDLAVDPRGLADVPLIEEAMAEAGFTRSDQPGTWTNRDGIPVDLMVPEAALADRAGSRGARVPPHNRHAMRRARGLEAAIIDAPTLTITGLGHDEHRLIQAAVASPAALLVAKLHKINERSQEDPERLVDKDAHDIYRLLVAIDTEVLATALTRLLRDELAGEVTRDALGYLRVLFAGSGPESLGAMMAGRAEAGVGQPAVVAASVNALAEELLNLTES